MKFVPKSERGAGRCGGVARTRVGKTEKNADALAVGRLQVAAILQETLAGAVNEFAGQLPADAGGRSSISSASFAISQKTKLASHAVGSDKFSDLLSVRRSIPPARDSRQKPAR